MSEIAWLIEGRINGHWYAGVMGWTYDSAQAVRFCRKRDAECVIAGLRLTDHFASEHAWITSSNPKQGIEP